MRSLKAPAWLLALAAIALGSCTEPKAKTSTLTLSLGVQQSHAAPVVLRAVIGDNAFELRAAAGDNAASQQLQLSPVPAVAMTLVVYSAAGDGLGGAVMSHEIRTDYQYGMAAVIGFVRPVRAVC